MTNLLPIGVPKHLATESRFEPRSDLLGGFNALPCVVYEADERFRVTSVTPNTKELLGIDAANLSALNWFCNDRVAFPDRELLQNQLARLRSHSSVWLIHRLMTDNGILVKVAHSARSRTDGSRRYYQGCLTPVTSDGLERPTIDIETVSKFIHKIGNHFQLLNLMFDSIQRSGASAKNLDALQQTTETAIGLTRGFVNLLQFSLTTNTIDLAELVESAVESRSYVGNEKETSIELQKDAANENIKICGDAALLEMAIAAVIENAIEASPRGAAVLINLFSQSEATSRFGLNTAVVRVVDYGPGICEEQLAQVTQPFYTTRLGHEGMGLSIASRYVELHGGFVHLTSGVGQGTQVDIVLPIVDSSTQSRENAELK
jgi:signal transduction histidine kinase